MASVAVFFTAGLVLVGLYWFVCLLGSPEQKGKRAVDLKMGTIARDHVEDKYNQYWSFFRRSPKDITSTVTSSAQVPQFVDTFYNLVTDIYEWGWGQSFHFSPSIPGASHRAATRLHEERAADLISARSGQTVLDVGCGVGGPMRAIAAHSGARVVGITINEYQVSRARAHNKNARLDRLCEVFQGNFLQMPFADASFDSAYAIEATCHAPKLADVYAEVYRVLKPGGMFVSYEWVTTGAYDATDSDHVEVVQGIERGDALPGLRKQDEVSGIARGVGFEVMQERDLALPPAGPWWTRLKMGRVAYWRNHLLVTVMTWLGVAPRGVADVHEMLYHTAVHLSKGGELGIFTPMHMILCRKPSHDEAQEAT